MLDKKCNYLNIRLDSTILSLCPFFEKNQSGFSFKDNCKQVYKNGIYIE